jgi:hypothetical protein
MKRSTPERTYLLAEWGSRLLYRKAAELLEELMPASFGRLSHTSVRRYTLSVGALLKQRVTDATPADRADGS